MSLQVAAAAEPNIAAAAVLASQTGHMHWNWRDIVHSLPVGICACDAEGRLVQYNDKAAELWGRSPDLQLEHSYCGALKVFRLSGEPMLLSQSPMAELLLTGQPLRKRQFIIERPDGRRVFIEADLDPVRDRTGKMVGGVNCFRDISAEKEAERHFQQILQALPMAVYTTDADGRITFFNEAAAALWAYRPELGSSQWCGSWRLRTIDGEPMPHDECPMAVALREGREVPWGRAVAERPDGTLVPFVAFPTPLRDANGTLVGAVNTLIDASSQQRLSEAGMHLAAIVESSMDAIVSKDLNSIITSWNSAAERLFGYTAAEAVGKPVTMLIPQGQQSEEVSIITRIRRGERVATYETTRRHKDGHLFPVSLTVSPIRDAKGNIVGASKIARDITGHKESERRIRLLMREVNHRVKNQYAVILSIIRETSRRWKDPAEFERHVRERIMALSDSHDLLVSTDWKGTTTGDLLQAQVAAFAGGDRISASGPPLLLSPNAVQYLGIAFHELATNAAKYGALSNKTGRIAVDWQTVTEPSGSKRFELTWRETDGPAATESSRTGFGTVVLLRVAPQAMNGSGEIVYGDEGLIWRFHAPLETVTAREDPLRRE
jgi:PAS domain S-box-containing protein